MDKYILLGLGLICLSCTQQQQATQSDGLGELQLSENRRFFEKGNGEPFFWLGDTGWLLFGKLNREEAERYLENRHQKGFNVIQVMTLHTLDVVNVYGDSALINGNVAQPNVSEGSSFEDSVQYDFWDHVDYIVDKAAENNLYMALVPVWGSNVKSGRVSRDEAEQYATFLAERYKDRPNIIWLNGGDISGSDYTEIWNTIGTTLNANDPNHLITFHPFGRSMSSTWFHNQNWLDFNMFQSGHRRYDQDTASDSHQFGPDNWRYVQVDYNLRPVKPTLDGEPSYENIPQGLHDPNEPYWNDNDVRRYGYWSVFAGAAGFTYGHNAVMQMSQPTDKGSAYGVKDYWYDAIDHPGASQVIYLKELMLSRPYFERVPDQSLVANQGEKYEYIAATRGEDYAFLYTYNGRTIQVNMGKIAGDEVETSWYNPRNGESAEIGVFENEGMLEFDPPGEKEEGNDWVLILDQA